MEVRNGNVYSSLGSIHGLGRNLVVYQGGRMSHAHHYIITNYIGKCQCGAEKDFTPKKIKLTRERRISALEFDFNYGEPYKLHLVELED